MVPNPLTEERKSRPIRKDGWSGGTGCLFLSFFLRLEVALILAIDVGCAVCLPLSASVGGGPG